MRTYAAVYTRGGQRRRAERAHRERHQLAADVAALQSAAPDALVALRDSEPDASSDALV